MALFKKSINQQNKQDFLEYLAFQTKTGASFKKAVERYLENDRPKHVLDACEYVVSMIDLGESPASALYEAGFISAVEFTMLQNQNSNVYEAISLAVNMNKQASKSADVLKGSMRAGILMLLGLLLLIPIFREDIEGIYKMFAGMASLNSSTGPAQVQLPFLVKYWWSVFIVIGVIFLISLGFKYVFKYIYANHGRVYYSIFKYKIYSDLMAILETLRQMQKSMSDTQSYIALAHSAPNSYWKELFDDVVNNLKEGRKASEVFAMQRGLIPVDVIHCVMDGEDTGEMATYLVKASDYCKNRYEAIQDSFRTGVPIFFDVLLYFLIGLVVVKFTNDMNELGIMQVLTQLK